MEKSTIENNVLVDLNPTMLILILNTRGQNIPIKSQRLSGWIEKARLVPQEMNFKYKDILKTSE